MSGGYYAVPAGGLAVSARGDDLPSSGYGVPGHAAGNQMRQRGGDAVHGRADGLSGG